MNKLKNKNGITLVALIITIIVLLILAMVSISLVINSGIITKSKDSVDKYSKEEIGEQLKLAYSEYQMSQYTGTPMTAQDIQTKLGQIFGAENVTDVSLANGKLTAKINGKKYDYDIATGTAGEHVYVDPFNYGEGKTKTTVAAGNEITITNGTTTEYFTVISNTNGTILAMPKYNITLTEDHPVQSSSAGTTSFSTRAYWSSDEQGNEISGWNSEAVNNAVDIGMSNAANNIQKYINAYKTTLEDMGAEGITVRAAKFSEIDAEGVTPAMKNPGQTGDFWLGSGYSSNGDGVWYVFGGGLITSDYYYGNSWRGSSSYNYLLI